MTNLMKRVGLAVLVLGLTAVAEGRAEAGLTVYATESGGGNSTFGTLDLMTGQFRQVATMSVALVSLTRGANGTLYGGALDGNLYTVSGNGVATRFGTVSGPSFFGLAYAGASGFYGADANTNGLDQISASGTSFSTLAVLPAIVGSGALSYGPNGSLYYVGSDSLGTTALFSVNPTTGATTEIGSGLGSFANDPLTLVSIGAQLYGIDTGEASGTGPINIYTINTTTGLATATGVTVTGLAAGFTLDTAALIPEPSSLALCGIASVVGLAVVRARRKNLAA